MAEKLTESITFKLGPKMLEELEKEASRKERSVGWVVRAYIKRGQGRSKNRERKR